MTVEIWWPSTSTQLPSPGLESRQGTGGGYVVSILLKLPALKWNLSARSHFFLDVVKQPTAVWSYFSRVSCQHTVAGLHLWCCLLDPRCIGDNVWARLTPTPASRMPPPMPRTEHLLCRLVVGGEIPRCNTVVVVSCGLFHAMPCHLWCSPPFCY